MIGVVASFSPVSSNIPASPISRMYVSLFLPGHYPFTFSPSLSLSLFLSIPPRPSYINVFKRDVGEDEGVGLVKHDDCRNGGSWVCCTTHCG